jgi:deoxyadenosine/deoxycytidine kinase
MFAFPISLSYIYIYIYIYIYMYVYIKLCVYISILYIDVPYPMSRERIGRRNRTGESQVPLDYLERLDRVHRQLASRMEASQSPLVILPNTEADAGTIRARGREIVERVAAMTLPPGAAGVERFFAASKVVEAMRVSFVQATGINLPM